MVTDHNLSLYMDVFPHSATIYDAVLYCNGQMDGRTNGQVDSRKKNYDADDATDDDDDYDYHWSAF